MGRFSMILSQKKFARKTGAAIMLAVLVFPSLLPATVRAEDNAGDIQDNISKIEKKLKQATERKASLEQNLGQINKALSATVAAISATQAAIRETQSTLERKQLEIQLLGQQIDLKTELLSEIMQDMYFNGQTPEMDTVLGEESLSTVTDQQEHYASFQERVNGLLDGIQDLKVKTDEEKSKLEDIKEQKEDILDAKVDQKQDLASDQAETKQDIQEQAATIAELQKKLQKLRSDLSSLLGTDISTDDVKEAAAIASKATGVRKAFILGELTQESGLGRFTGGCLYKNTRVKPADKTAFKQIMDELGYDVNKKKISCSPGYGYGGAMGIAQFMPTTWLGYKSKISAMTGHNPPNPWSVIDGTVGMAIKLANAGATSKSGEKNAAKVYYCGSPRSPYWKTKCESYANNVLRLAAGYENN